MIEALICFSSFTVWMYSVWLIISYICIIIPKLLILRWLCLSSCYGETYYFACVVCLSVCLSVCHKLCTLNDNTFCLNRSKDFEITHHIETMCIANFTISLIQVQGGNCRSKVMWLYSIFHICYMTVEWLEGFWNNSPKCSPYWDNEQSTCYNLLGSRSMSQWGV